LLDEMVNHASFDVQEIEKIKREKLQSIRQMRDNPSSLAFEEFKTAMWKDTPYGVTGIVMEKTLPAINKADIMEYYENIFYPQNLVISVNGNVDEKEILNYFSKIFNGCNGEK